VVPPRPKAPPLASTTPLAATPAAASPVDAIPCLHDEAAREDTAELPSKPAAAPLPQPVQSGRTVPLSAALLADVLKSVDDRRAAAEAAAAAAPSAPPVPLDAPRRSRRPMVALAVVLAIGLSVFVTGVVMFLDALE
jgi:hypothetical protein